MPRGSGSEDRRSTHPNFMERRIFRSVARDPLGIFSTGLIYATACGVFNTIRWGIVMVLVQALEALTLTGGLCLGAVESRSRIRSEMVQDLREGPLQYDTINLVFPMLTTPSHHEIYLVVMRCRSCRRSSLLHLSFSLGIGGFALYLLGSEPVAATTQYMWRVSLFNL